jgi:cell wall-associated NlpC family hydrolase
MLDLIGIPYEPRGRTKIGADCWGICLLVGKELGINFPDNFYSEVNFLQDAAKILDTERTKNSWTPIELYYRPGDIALFRIKGFVTHCGIMVNSSGDFLHSLEGRNSCLENLDDSTWISRLSGVYRWAM